MIDAQNEEEVKVLEGTSRGTWIEHRNRSKCRVTNDMGVYFMRMNVPSGGTKVITRSESKRFRRTH